MEHLSRLLDLTCLLTRPSQGAEEDDDLSSPACPPPCIATAREATMAFRGLRDSLALPETQDAARQGGLGPALLQVVLEQGSHVGTASDTVGDPVAEASVVELRRMLLAALQCCCNYVASNVVNREETWSSLFPDGFTRLLLSYRTYRKGLAYVVAMINTCVATFERGGEDGAPPSGHLAQLASHRPLIGLLARSVAPGATAAATADAEDSDPAFEWFYILWSQLCSQGLCKTVYEGVGVSHSPSAVSSEQLVCLRMVEAVVCDVHAFEKGKERASVHTIMAWLVELLSKMPHSRERLTEGEDFEIVQQRMQEEATRWILRGLSGALQVWGGGKLPNVLESEGHATLELLVTTCLDMMTALGSPAVRSGLDGGSERRSSAPPAPPDGRKVDVMKVICNAAFRYPAAQDVMREKGGLVVVLNQFNIEEANPFLGEWATLALRNLCEGNPTNQSRVSQLQKR